MLLQKGKKWFLLASGVMMQTHVALHHQFNTILKILTPFRFSKFPATTPPTHHPHLPQNFCV